MNYSCSSHDAHSPGVMMFLELADLGVVAAAARALSRRRARLLRRQIGWIFATQAIACLAGLYARRPDRGPDALDRETPVGAPHRRHRDVRARLPDDVLVVLRRDAGVSAGLHADDVADQRGGVPSRRRSAEGLRPHPPVGTIGWIAASWPFVFILAGKTGPDLHAALSSIFTVAGMASIALAAFSLTLPHTPPAKQESASSAPMEAIKLLRDPVMLVLFVATLMDALVHQCYFQWTSPFLQQAGLAELDHAGDERRADRGDCVDGGARVGAGRLRLEVDDDVGILAHAARFFVFAIGDPLWLMVAINVVHGMCYAFFFAAVYIFVDERCPRDARASAQGLFNLVILGVGPFAGSLLWGWLGDVFRNADGSVDFSRLFIAPAVLGLAAAICDGGGVPANQGAG